MSSSLFGIFSRLRYAPQSLLFCAHILSTLAGLDVKIMLGHDVSTKEGQVVGQPVPNAYRPSIHVCWTTFLAYLLCSHSLLMLPFR